VNPSTLVRERKYGDFSVRLEYINPNPREIGSRHEPALLICRPPQSGNKSACVIMLNAAHQYVENGQSGKPSMYALEQAIVFCKVLGLYPDKNTLFSLITAIIDNLDDLYDMPPYEAPTKVVGEAALTVNGQTYTAEITH
jgi:hypothetical protein